jgi:hypothetical protein
MKYILFLFFLSVSVNAQDIITLRNGDQIRARVTEISNAEIRYKNFDNLEGPTRVLQRADIFAINYENGTREVLNPLTSQPQQNQQTTEQPQQSVNQQRQTPTATQSRGFMMEANLALAIFEGEPLFGISPGAIVSLSDESRLEIAFTYFFPKSDGLFKLTLWDLDLNYRHYFSTSEKLVLYPLAGLGIVGAYYAGWGNETKVCFNLGGGMQVELGEKTFFNLGLKYKFAGEDFSFFKLSAGLAFKF